MGWLFAGRVISGGATANIVVASAYIADTTEPEKRAAGYGMLSAAFGLGFVVGPLLGGVLGSYGARVPFWVAAAMSLANFLYGTFILPESLRVEDRKTSFDWKRLNPVAALSILGSHRELAGLTWVTVLGFIAHEVVNIYIIYILAIFGWSTAQGGYTLTLVGIVGVISMMFLIKPLVARFGERRLLLIGLGFCALSYAMFGINNGWVFLAGIVVSALALYNSPSQALMSKRVSSAEQGALQGAIGSIRGLSWIVGPTIFFGTFSLFLGPWKSLHLPGAPWFLASLIMIGALFLAARVTGREDNVVLNMPTDLISVSPLE